MHKYKKLILCLTVMLVGIAFTVWCFQRPRRVTQAFVGHLSQERYEEAGRMLIAPSAVKVESDGEVMLTDRVGISTVVPRARLPFLVGGMKVDGPGDFAMTALQGSVNGLLDPPAVTIYLRIDNGKLHIESVEDYQ